ncbi:MAG TPA: 7-cyano-7-deazaguanine synthase QueC [Agitococcus sp.]|nr:7-cyano-7-deazaguanine synthase QueC [Agitococcus sp.]
MTLSHKPRAVVLLSGGLDSATCLAIAQQTYDCYALSFAYGQRHNSELAAASRLAIALNAKEHRIINIDLGGIGGSALTDTSIAVPEEASQGIPVTYVPARNTVFLAFALGFAEVVGADAIVIGVNAVDYSGYPDCRPEYIAAFQQLANLATKAGVEGHPLNIETPLLHLSKAAIIQQGTQLGVDYALTVSCYQADLDGKACGKCDSCRLRKEGFLAAGLADPTRYR